MSIVNDALKKAASTKDKSKKGNQLALHREEQWIFQAPGDPWRRGVAYLVFGGAVLLLMGGVWWASQKPSSRVVSPEARPGQVMTAPVTSPVRPAQDSVQPPGFSQRYQKGLQRYRAKQYAEAEKEFSAILAQDPGQAVALNNLGLVHHAQGREEQAISAYLSAIKINPNFAEAMNNLGLLYDQQGRADDAIALYDLALRINPDYSEAHLNYGIILERLGYLAEAKQHYRRFLSQAPPDLSDVVVSIKARLSSLQ